MRKIFKYKLQITDEQWITVPKEPNILTVGVQHGDLYLWAEVSPDAEEIEYQFFIYGTGHPIDQTVSKAYIGTVHDNGYVWHVFVKVNRSA